MSVTIEQVIDKATLVVAKRDSRRIEVGQAAAAAVKALVEQGEANQANETEDISIANFKNTAAGYGKEGTSQTITIEDVLAQAQRVLEARGNRVIQVDEASAAIAKSIQEQAEADTANIDEDTAIEELRTVANDYTKEPEAA